MIAPDAAELRVLGALLEKHRTTPDAYPLSLNALRLAANQSTGRDPVVDYDEATIREAIARLVRRGWARLASGPGSRATKYRHLLDEALSLSAAELSLLAVLMLRGPQTPGELRQRTERLYAFTTIEQLEALLAALEARRLVVQFGRRPGQKEARWSLGEDLGVTATTDTTPVALAAGPSPAPEHRELEQRVAALELGLAELRALVAELRAASE
jgi:uncharacterized protein